MSQGSRATPCTRSPRAFVAVCSLLTLPCAGAHAAPDPVSIEWSAPAGCPSYADVASWLDAVLPPEVKQRLRRAQARVTLESAAGAGFRATVVIEAESEDEPARVQLSERTLEGTACEELARSAVIVVSVALTEAAQNETPAAPSPAPQAEKQRAAPAKARAEQPMAPKTPPPARARRRPSVAVALGASSGFGDVALRTDLSARLPLSEVMTLGVRARAVPSDTVETPRGDVALHLVAAGPELCLAATASPALQLGACLRGELGWFGASGSGARGRSDSALWSALGALPFVEWGGDVRLLVAGDADVRLLRPTLSLDDATLLERLPRFAYSGLVGLAVTIP